MAAEIVVHFEFVFLKLFFLDIGDFLNIQESFWNYVGFLLFYIFDHNFDFWS